MKVCNFIVFLLVSLFASTYSGDVYYDENYNDYHNYDVQYDGEPF